MSAARRRGVVAGALVGLGLALGACGGATEPAVTASSAPPTTSTSPVERPLSAVPSAPAQGLVSSTFEVGQLVPCVVTRVSSMLVLVSAQDRSGVIRGSASERVKVGDRVTVQITQPDGRFEAKLIHVATRS